MSETATLRRFNRTYTQRIGALEESYLGLGIPLGPARLLFEVGARRTTVRDLRTRLGLDSGYVARQLRLLEDRGLVQTAPDPADRRRRLVRLTRRGSNAWRRLEDRSEALATQLLEPLSGRQRERLAEALTTADLLVRAATVDLHTVDLRSADATQAMRQYFVELDRRFPQGFDIDAALREDARRLGGERSAFVVASSDGEPVACGGVHELSRRVGEIKRMWVAADWRGAGLGARVLRRLEELSAGFGHRMVRLDTNATLTEAVAMYVRAGYRPIRRYNDNPDAQAWFERRLTRGSASPSR